MRIHILGSGTPTPSADRFGTSFVAEVGDEQIMIDCGPATTHKLVRAGLWPTDISTLFFTHHHFDHNVDYPCFLLCRWDQSVGKEVPLRVFGPTLTTQITEGLIGESGVFAPDWRARVSHPASQQVYVNRGGTLPRRPPEVKTTDIDPGHVVESSDWTMTSAYADHVQPFLDSLAYRLDTADGSVVFTGDTEPCDSVVELAKEADALFAMCWDDQDVMEAQGEDLGVMGPAGAADMARRAGVRKLVLVHSQPTLNDRETADRAVERARSLFDGEVVLANELTVLEF
ncbi:MAG TPA: MBL fold metallo-hydrolase [Acidimicrobiia bacterium]